MNTALLPLPVSAAQCLSQMIAPACALLTSFAPSITYDTAGARSMLLAIGLQESNLAARVQSGGPARGLWQFEVGGVAAVLNHAAVGDLAHQLCGARAVLPNAVTTQAALSVDDILAAGFARLLLYADPAGLPSGADDGQAGWAIYLREWRPGRPRPDAWARNWDAAVTAVQETLA